MKAGIKTSEFQLTAVVTAILTLLVGYGVLTEQQSEDWLNMCIALMPILPALYALLRTSLKK